MNCVQRAREQKTAWLERDPVGFKTQLIKEIRSYQKKALKLGLNYAVRLNGTSDLDWTDVITACPDVQFYDYTKRPDAKELPNYRLTFSRAESNEVHVDQAMMRGLNVAAVFQKQLPRTYLGRPVINGDNHDVRCIDPKGVIIGLIAKGRARKDCSGFVIQN